MKNLFYPAIFHKTEEGGFGITFPDLPECKAQGADLQDAYEMAANALGQAITSRLELCETLSTPSDPFHILLDKGCFCAVIEFDLASYLKRTGSKTVQRTLPEWFNEECRISGIDFSFETE